MTPIEIFILRQKTRPSEEECQQFFLRCLATNEERLLDLLKDMANPSHPQCAMQSANLNRETDDIDKTLEVFIKAEGGERYLKDRSRFSLETFRFISGNPPEQTRVAIAYVNDLQQRVNEHIPEVADFLSRGHRWEELERWGDALGCYYIGLILHADHPVLLARLGNIQVRYPRYLVTAVENLKKAIELCPTNWAALFCLGRAHRLVADSPEIQVKGRTKEELRQIALSFLQRAALLQPSNSEIRAELDSLCKELGIASDNKRSGFFG
jgi:tetratricopeptide (TPR) repeat protein